MVRHALLLLMLTAGLSGCATFSGEGDRDGVRPLSRTSGENSVVARAAAPQPEPNPEENRAVHRDLIRSMLAQGQYYAALAHIEEQKRGAGDSLDLRYLEAEAKRHLGKTTDALRLYNGLLNTALDGEAHHGIGLIVFASDRAGAVQHLRTATQRRPTDAQFRNDLGFALMEAGRYSEALAELATAVELDPAHAMAKRNLIVLLLVSGDVSRARQLARDSGMNDEGFAAAQKRAEMLAQTTARSGQKR